jgi:hypothetical protein
VFDTNDYERDALNLMFRLLSTPALICGNGRVGN